MALCFENWGSGKKFFLLKKPVYFIFAFQFSSMGVPLLHYVLICKIHLHTTKDEPFKPIIAETLYLYKTG